MFGRLFDMLNLDGELMVASTKLFVAKEEAARNFREMTDGLFHGDKESEADDEEEEQEELDFIEDGNEKGKGITGFVLTAMEQVKKNKEMKQEEDV